MSGGSQSLLVRSADSLYVVKCPFNKQGPNVTANEFLGTQLMDALGLPTPGWRLAQFRDPSNCPQCALQGLISNRRPLHFASALLTSTPGTQAQVSIPRSDFDRVENRTDFLKAFVFDIWGGAIASAKRYSYTTTPGPHTGQCLSITVISLAAQHGTRRRGAGLY